MLFKRMSQAKPAPAQVKNDLLMAESDLQKVAAQAVRAGQPGNGGQAVDGQRSGEGLGSVLEHMTAADKQRRAGRDTYPDTGHAPLTPDC